MIIGKNCFYFHNFFIYFKTFPILFANDKGGEDICVCVWFIQVSHEIFCDPYSFLLMTKGEKDVAVSLTFFAEFFTYLLWLRGSINQGGVLLRETSLNQIFKFSLSSSKRGRWWRQASFKYHVLMKTTNYAQVCMCKKKENHLDQTSNIIQ